MTIINAVIGCGVCSGATITPIDPVCTLLEKSRLLVSFMRVSRERSRPRDTDTDTDTDYDYDYDYTLRHDTDADADAGAARDNDVRAASRTFFALYTRSIGAVGVRFKERNDRPVLHDDLLYIYVILAKDVASRFTATDSTKVFRTFHYSIDFFLRVNFQFFYFEK